MVFLGKFKARMRVVLAEQHRRLDIARKETREKQQSLVEASRAKKTLQILKDNEIKKQLEKITRIERKNMDEIAGNLFIQKSKNR
jgi:flagellar export protein FliJ